MSPDNIAWRITLDMPVSASISARNLAQELPITSTTDIGTNTKYPVFGEEVNAKRIALTLAATPVEA